MAGTGSSRILPKTLPDFHIHFPNDEAALLIYIERNFRPVSCVDIAGNKKTRSDHHTRLLVGRLFIVAGIVKETPASQQVQLCIEVSNHSVFGFGQHSL